MCPGIGIGFPIWTFPPAGLPLITSPLDIANCFLWLDGSDISTLFQTTDTSTPVTTTGDPVGRISDKSGAGNHVTQATGSAKPAYTTGVQNGLSALSHDGGDYLDTAGSFNSFPLTIMGVVRTNATIGTNRGIVANYHSTTFGSRVFLNTSNIFQVVVATPSATRSSVASFGANTTLVYGARFNTTESANLANGALVSGVHSASVVANIIRIGGLTVNSGASALNGFSCEIVAYSAALADQQMTQVSNYLNLKWAGY